MSRSTVNTLAGNSLLHVASLVAAAESLFCPKGALSSLIPNALWGVCVSNNGSRVSRCILVVVEVVVVVVTAPLYSSIRLYTFSEKVVYVFPWFFGLRGFLSR